MFQPSDETVLGPKYKCQICGRDYYDATDRNICEEVCKAEWANYGEQS